MRDLIERQAAIDAIVKWAESHHENPDGDDCIMIILEVPSAQPKPCEDTISRQDAIRIVDGIDTWQAGWRGDAIESMKALPSAQPETHEERTETHSCDCISRKAAIDVEDDKWN